MEWRDAAVIFAVFADAPHGVVFIERAGHLRRHANQVALPGGIADPGDGGNPAVTALRELHEEVGVASDRVRIVGQLPGVRQVANRFLVTPMVGILDPGAPLTIDHTETVGVFTVPLAAIVEPGAVREDTTRSKTLGRTLYAFDYGGHHIWGLTARILKSFTDLWNAPSSELRASIESSLRRPTENL